MPNILNMSGDTQNLSELQLEVKLITRQQSYAVPDVPLSVPLNIDTKALNNLLNELLKENATGDYLKPIIFDFLAFGQLIRTPLHEHLLANQASTEATVEIEYVESTPAPQPEDALLHDDWVAGLQTNGNLILTGCYDSTVNLWSTKGKHKAVGKVHTNYVRAVAWISRTDPSQGFISCSQDTSAIIWQVNPEASEVEPKMVLRGHERGVETVSTSPNGARVVTGGWDTNVKIWSTSLEQDDGESPMKKSKGVMHRVPLVTLKGHKELISGSQWMDNSSIVTCSNDHTIKVWDAELCGLKTEAVGQKAFLSVSWSALNNTLLTSSADRYIRMYDPRSQEGSVCKATYTSHSLWVSSVRWSNYDEHLFVSGSYDKFVKLWDTRCTKAPLYDLQGHQDKVLCVDWSNDDYLVSGGADNCVNIFKNSRKA